MDIDQIERLKPMEIEQRSFEIISQEAGDAIPTLLEKQVQSSVYWEDTVRRMEADGIDTILEIGPGKTLTSFVKKTAPGIQTYHIDTADDFEAVAEQLKGAAQ